MPSISTAEAETATTAAREADNSFFLNFSIFTPPFNKFKVNLKFVIVSALNTEPVHKLGIDSVSEYEYLLEEGEQ